MLSSNLVKKLFEWGLGKEALSLSALGEPHVLALFLFGKPHTYGLFSFGLSGLQSRDNRLSGTNKPRPLSQVK